jgi:hypothetical protein
MCVPVVLLVACGSTSDPHVAAGPGSTAPRSCPSFALSLVAGARGEPTPVRAAELYASRAHVSGPAWHIVHRKQNEVTLESGNNTLHTIEGLDHTWLVDSGSLC